MTTTTPLIGEAKRPHGAWPNIIRPAAQAIVESYDTGVTLRQLFYRLVSLPLDDPARLRNTKTEYTALAKNSADWRRDSGFPDLVDQTRDIIGGGVGYESPREYIDEMLDDALACYQRTPTEGQPYQIWLGTEKAGLVNQLHHWFGARGLHIISLGGYASQTYVNNIVRQVNRDGRPAILIYGGDHDPTGWSILTDFVDRTDCWSNPELREYRSAKMPIHLGAKTGHAKKLGVIPNYDRYRKFKVALTPEQCVTHQLPRNFAKENDNNLNTFNANFADTLTAQERRAGRGVQVEVDALDPAELRRLYTVAVETFWDADAYDAMLARQTADRKILGGIINKIGEVLQ